VLGDNYKSPPGGGEMELAPGSPDAGQRLASHRTSALALHE